MLETTHTPPTLCKFLLQLLEIVIPRLLHRFRFGDGYVVLFTRGTTAVFCFVHSILCLFATLIVEKRRDFVSTFSLYCIDYITIV